MLATTPPSVRTRPVVPAQPVDPTTVCLIGIPCDITMRDIETIKIQLGPTVKVIDVQVPTDHTGATGLLFLQFADPYHVARVFDVGAVPGGIPAFGRLLMVKQATANWREQYMRRGRRPRQQAAWPAPESVLEPALALASEPTSPRPAPQSTPESSAIDDENDHDGHGDYDDVQAAGARKRQSSAGFDDTLPYEKHVSQPPSQRSSRSASHAVDTYEATPRSPIHTYPRTDTDHVPVSSLPKQVYPPLKQIYPRPKQVYQPPPRQSSTSISRSGPASPSHARDRRSAPPPAAPWARDKPAWSQGANLTQSDNHAVKVEPPPPLPEATTKREEVDPEQLLMRGSRWELIAAAPSGSATQAPAKGTASANAPTPAHPTGNVHPEIAVAVESASAPAATTYATASATWSSESGAMATPSHQSRPAASAPDGSHGHARPAHGYHPHHQHQNSTYLYDDNSRGRGRGRGNAGGSGGEWSGGRTGRFRSRGWPRGSGSVGRGSGWGGSSSSSSRGGSSSSSNQRTSHGTGRGNGRGGYRGERGWGY